VQQSVAQQFRGCVAQLALGQGQMSAAGEQVRGQGDDLGPRDVDRPLPRGPPVQAEVLGLFDVVLEVDMGAVPRVEPADLPDTGVGGDELVAAPELFLPFGGPLAVAGGAAARRAP